MAKKKADKKPTKKIQLTMGPLTTEKVKQIQECLKKGELKIELTETDLGAGKLGSAWLYD